MKRIGFGLIISALTLSVSLSACGSDAPPPPPPAASPSTGEGDVTCFQQMDAAQKAQLQQYATEQGHTTQTAGENANGTQDICVLEPNGKGGCEQHSYSDEDRNTFADYYLYSLVAGRMGGAQGILAYGYINDDLDLGDVMLLSLLMDVDRDGRCHRPYTRGSDGSWTRGHTVVNNVTVTQVRYGKNPPVKFAEAQKQAPPKGYAKTMTLPKASTATRQRDPNIQRGGLGAPGATGKAPAPPAAPATPKATPPKAPPTNQQPKQTQQKAPATNKPAPPTKR